MITKFDTGSAAAASAGSKDGSNTVLIVVGLIIVGVLAYQFVIKPAMEKKKAEEAKTAS